MILLVTSIVPGKHTNIVVTRMMFAHDLIRKMVQTRRDKLFERFFLEYIFIRMVMIQFNISVNCANIE